MGGYGEWLKNRRLIKGRIAMVGYDDPANGEKLAYYPGRQPERQVALG